MTQQRVFFSFADGLFSYSCDDCTQPCCHLQQLPLTSDETTLITSAYPSTKLLLDKVDETHAVLQLPPAGCWFLDNHTCRLKTDSAKQMRPSVCELFPFNLYGWMGEVLVVGVNGLCPLTPLPDSGIRYTELKQKLNQYPLVGDVTEIRPEYGAALLPLEEAIVSASGMLVEEDDILLIIGFMELATRAWLQGDTELEHIDVSKIDTLVHDYLLILEIYSRLIGINLPPVESFTRCARALTAWAPTIRLFGFDNLPLVNQPRAFLVLSLLLANWQTLRPERTVLPQTLMQMISSMKPVIHLLSIWFSDWTGEANEQYRLMPGMQLQKTIGEQFEKIANRNRISWLHNLAKELKIS